MKHLSKSKQDSTNQINQMVHEPHRYRMLTGPNFSVSVQIGSLKPGKMVFL